MSKTISHAIPSDLEWGFGNQRKWELAVQQGKTLFIFLLKPRPPRQTRQFAYDSLQDAFSAYCGSRRLSSSLYWSLPYGPGDRLWFPGFPQCLRTIVSSRFRRLSTLTASEIAAAGVCFEEATRCSSTEQQLLLSLLDGSLAGTSAAPCRVEDWAIFVETQVEGVL